MKNFPEFEKIREGMIHEGNGEFFIFEFGKFFINSPEDKIQDILCMIGIVFFPVKAEENITLYIVG